MLAAATVQPRCLTAIFPALLESRFTAGRAYATKCAGVQSRSALAGLFYCPPTQGLQLAHRQDQAQCSCESILRNKHVTRCGNDAEGRGVPELPPDNNYPVQSQHPDDQAATDGSADAAAFRRAAQAMHGSNSDETLLQELQARTRRLQALEEYREHMLREEAEFDLLECALLIAKHAHPNLDEAKCRNEIEKLSDDVWEVLPADPAPLRIVQAINNTLYSKNGFRGADAEQYYNPDNSCLNMVLATRVGIPITLGLLWWQVAKRCALPVIGLNLPGHFMLAPAADDLEIIIDPHNGGEVLFLQDAAEKLASIHGIAADQVVIDPRVLKHKASHAIQPRAFLTRILFNLKNIYAHRFDVAATLAIIQYLRATAPKEAQHLRDEGICLGSLARHAEAATCLLQYLALEPRAADAAQIRELLDRFGALGGDDAQEV